MFEPNTIRCSAFSAGTVANAMRRIFRKTPAYQLSIESQNRASLATLPIAPWERYMALDYGPHHSMTCHSRFWFQGVPDRQVWIEALTELANRNPFLALQWTSQSWKVVPFDPATQIDWQTSSTPIELTHLPTDETRMQFIVRTGKLSELGHHDAAMGMELGTILVVKYPHSNSDGNGILSLVNQLREHCEGELAQRQTVHDLAFRMRMGLTTWQRVSRMRWDLQRILKYFACRPKAYIASKRGNASDVPASTCVKRRVGSREWMTKVQSFAHDRRVQVNDLLIASLFRALAATPIGGTMRISIPTSMRPADNASVCNLVSMVFLDRHPNQTGTEHFLESIAKEMRNIKERKLGHAMLSFLGIATLGRGRFMRFFLQHSKTNVTSVLTNLGQPFREHANFQVGTCKLLALDSIPPLRPGTNILFSVNRYGDELSVTVRYEPSLVDSDSAQSLLDRFFLECESWATR